MKTTFLIILVSIFSYSCNSPKAKLVRKAENEDSVKIYNPRAGTYYETDLTGELASVIADTITYDVLLRNNNKEDEWAEYCLKNVDIRALTDAIFNAVYTKRLIAYDYITEDPMTIQEVKEMEQKPEFSRDKISKAQFMEEWYFDEKTLKMGKRVNSLMLAYESRDAQGKIRRYKAGFKVYFKYELPHADSLKNDTTIVQ